MKTALKNSLPIAEAFAQLLHPFAEVVIHNLQTGKIEAIYNPFSKRSVGDSSFLDQSELLNNQNKNVIGPYEKINYDGRRLKSISIVLRDLNEKIIGFLCVNIDISIFENYRDALNVFLLSNKELSNNTKQILFKDDLHNQINTYIQNFCKSKYLSIENLSKKDKQDIILSLRENGALNGRNATSYVARILKTSRATIYNYIKVINQ